MLWQVGDGGNIRVWQDEWVPETSNHKLQPIEGAVIDQNLRVGQLIDHHTK